ncbi:hypothetical protein LSAT2_003497 [Lamellibrachia satsuma]|nr:hypothetical protein LSAT2_003497 [Lamellibrachia satsuma]
MKTAVIDLQTSLDLFLYQKATIEADIQHRICCARTSARKLRHRVFDDHNFRKETKDDSCRNAHTLGHMDTALSGRNDPYKGVAGYRKNIRAIVSLATDVQLSEIKRLYNGKKRNVLIGTGHRQKMAVLLQVLICCLATVAVRSSPLPPINGPCPIVDCLLQEQWLDCPEAQKVRSTFLVNIHNCSGCLICGEPFEEALPPQAEERGDGGNTTPKPTTTSSTAVAVCPDMDCSDYEDLDCPESEQIRYNYTQDDGTECPGCLECGDEEYDGDVGGDGEDDEAEGDTPSPDEGDPPPPAPVLSGGGSSAGRIPGMVSATTGDTGDTCDTGDIDE